MSGFSPNDPVPAAAVSLDRLDADLARAERAATRLQGRVARHALLLKEVSAVIAEMDTLIAAGAHG